MKRLLLFALLVFIFAACAGPGPGPEPSELVPRPSRTPTGQPPATPTLRPTATPSPTPMPDDHDVTKWHPPMYGHHHGASPHESLYGATYLRQTDGQEIAYDWTSSPLENCYDGPGCKHVGYVFLEEHGLNCPQTGRETGYNCINGYLVLVHTIGNIHAMHTDKHSTYGVFEVCDKAGECGLVGTGGVADYGVYHAGYKQIVCQLENDPTDYPYGTGPGLNHLPYRASIFTTLSPPFSFTINPQFWNSRGPSTSWARQFYPDEPNHTLQMSWDSVDAFDMPDPADCANPEAAVTFYPDYPELNHTLFKVFAIVLQNLPTERPFNGWTNRAGHVDPACTETTAECVPLLIEATVPLPSPEGDDQLILGLMSRGVDHIRCNDVTPCQEFDDGAAELLPPGYEE